MEVIFLLLTSCISFGLSETDMLDAKHQHQLPDKCTGHQFFVERRDGIEGCQPCLCDNDKWKCIENIIHPDKCCKKFGRACYATQCEEEDSSIVHEDDFCVTCNCKQSYWECDQWYNKTACCSKFRKLCDCYGADTKTVQTEKECHRCSCKDGFWNCDTKLVYSKNECCLKWDVHCPHCCADGTLKINLRNAAVVANTMNGSIVTVDKAVNPACSGKQSCLCSSTALVKIQFEKLKPYFGCAKEPMCGRRQVRIDLKLSNGIRKGIYFNIGDSVSNSGNGGSAKASTKNDAEIVAKDDNLHLYQSKTCKNQEIIYKKAFSFGFDKSHFHVGNNFASLYANGEEHNVTCDRCLFALNNDDDDTIYVGLNQAVDGSSKGIGICMAWFHWVCPSRRNDWVDYFIKEK